MGDYFMRALAEVVSFFVWAVASMTSIMARLSTTIDDGVSIIAGIIGVIGGIIWIITLRIKKKENIIALENAKLENEIKKEQLKNLGHTEI